MWQISGGATEQSSERRWTRPRMEDDHTNFADIINGAQGRRSPKGVGHQAENRERDR